MAFGLSLPEIYAHTAHYLFILSRIAVLLHVAPVFGDKAVSRRLRTALGFVITLLLAPVLPEPQAELLSAEGGWILLREAVTGAAIGLTLQLIFSAVRLSGEIIGMQMGLSFANFYDPGSGNSPVISRILNLLLTLLFLTFNGHLWILNLLAESFTILPVSSAPLLSAGMMKLAGYAGLIFSQGLMLGMPVIALLLCINMTLGLLNRLAPQLSIFVIGFPLTLTAGMVALYLMAPSMPVFTEHLTARVFSAAYEVLRALN